MRRAVLLLGALAALSAASGCAPKPRVLRVCADPNNLPFSNAARQGFENRLVETLAADLGMTVEYVWWAQRRGYVRNTLSADLCDVWPGVGAGLERLATTRPYYRSSYVFVTRADRDLDIASYEDPRLRRLTVGVQMIGDDGANTPPAHALARRRIIRNVRGYMIYGDYRQANPPAAIVRAVDRGEIDVAVVWGPLAGYFARQASHPLRLQPVSPQFDGAQWPMVFDVSLGVRKDRKALLDRLDAALERRRPEIQDLLAEFGVPGVQGQPARAPQDRAT